MQRSSQRLLNVAQMFSSQLIKFMLCLMHIRSPNLSIAQGKSRCRFVSRLCEESRRVWGPVRLRVGPCGETLCVYLLWSALTTPLALVHCQQI